MLLGRDQDLAAEVAALLLRGELVLPVHAGGAGRDHRGHQLVGVERAAEAGLGVGHDRDQPVLASGCPRRVVDLVGAEQRVVDAAHHRGDRVGRIQALVRVGVAGEVGVGGDLPAGQVDGLEPGLDLLHRLVAGQGAEAWVYAGLCSSVSCFHSRSAPRRASVCSSETRPRRRTTSGG